MRATAGVNPYRKVSISAWANEKVRKLEAERDAVQIDMVGVIAKKQKPEKRRTNGIR